MKILSYAALATLASLGFASASDLPSKKTTPVAPMMATSYSWAGPYLGVLAGYGLSGRLTGSDADAIRSSIPETKGGIFGAMAGYNFQSGSWVYGPEFDLGFSTADGKKSETSGLVSGENKTNQNAFGSARVRLGYAFNNVLVFATAGAAGTALKLSYNETGPGYTYHESYTKTLMGYTLGAGIEYGITQNVTARAEYRYASYQNEKFGDSKYGLDTHDIRAGLAYKF